MRATAVLVAGTLLLYGAEHSAAATFTFSFNNVGGGLVQGIVSGLADESVSAATSVHVTSNDLGFGVGEYVGSPSQNLFEVSDNQVREFDFLSFGVDNAAPAVQCCSLFLSSSEPGVPTEAGLTNMPNTATGGIDSGSTFAPASIPLPASIVMLGGALAALAGLRLRKPLLSRA